MLKKLLISTAVILVVGAGAAYFYANYQAKNLVDEQIASLVASGRYDAINYESLNVAPDGSVSMTNLVVEQDGLRAIINTIEITNFDYEHELPWHLDLTMSGFQFPDGMGALMDQENPLAAAYLSQLATDQPLPLTMHYQYQYSPEPSQQIDAKVQMSLANSFAFEATSVTRNIALETLLGGELGSADPAIAMEQFNSLMATGELASTTLTFSDQGLLDTLLQDGAKSNNVSVEDFRKLMITQARNLYLFAPQNLQGIAMQAGIELATFLEGQRTLIVSINPEFGGNFQQLQPQIMGAMFTGDFTKVVDLLHFEFVTH